MNRTLLDEAWKLLRIAQDACRKLRLDGRGSDISLPHEVRMFTLDFSPEGREGPGELQVTGSGRVEQWFKNAQEEWRKGWQPVATCVTSSKVLIGMPAGGAIVGRLYRTTDGTPVRESFTGVGTVFEGFIYHDIFENRTLIACQYGTRICYVEGGPFYWMPYPAPPEPGVNVEKNESA